MTREIRHTEKNQPDKNQPKGQNLPTPGSRKAPIEPSKDTIASGGQSGFLARYMIEFLRASRLSAYFALPAMLLLILSYFEILKSDTVLMILSVCLILAGLPLSAALRIDQLSMELGASYSRELILLIALVVSILNFSLILGFWRALYKK